MHPDTEQIVNLIAQSIALAHDGRHDAALTCIDRAIGTDPYFFPALVNRGTILTALARHDEAIDCFDRVLQLKPDLMQATPLRNAALHAALAAHDRALAHTPGNAETFYRRGLVLLKLQRFDDALASQERALSFEPNHVEALNQRGNILLEMDRHDEALACYDRVLAIVPDSAAALVNRANVLQKTGRPAQALSSYRQALAIAPALAEAAIEQAHCNLMLGNFEQGWPQFDARWQTSQLQHGYLKTQAAPWQGTSSLAQKTILLWAEQGFGDTLQFVRYAPFVTRTAQRVVLRVPRALHALLLASGQLAGITIIANDDPLPPHDLHCPLMSLPRAFHTTLQTIPADVPYVNADAARLEHWENTLGKKTRPRIGIVWAGRRQEPVNRTRDLQLACLHPFMSMDAEWISLQKDIPEEDRDVLKTLPIRRFDQELRDFADTAALIAHLDLVISVDTAVAHLASAMGKPVWIMLRRAGEWRWLEERSDSPWYPSARLFRQPDHGDWRAVIEDVMLQLQLQLQLESGLSCREK